MGRTHWDIISKFGLNVAEFHILSNISREGSSERDSLAKHIYKYSESVRPGSACTIQDYEHAINSLLSKGLIKVLTGDDCRRDKERWLNDDNQFCEEDVYYEGNLDFTVEGARLYGELEDRILHRAGKHRSRFDGIIGYKWKQGNVVSLFAKERKDIDKEIIVIKDDPSHLFEDKKHIIKIGEPYPIQNWWITRFDQLDNGWRVNIKYK